MSRGWGASGMPFTMFYLNHYTKAQKAITQTQQHQSQKTRKQQQATDMRLQPIEEQQNGDEVPRTLPYGSRYDSGPSANAQHSEYNGQVKEDEYVDGSSNAYLPSKPNSPRRQYNVPQLFVSYGWGPMG